MNSVAELQTARRYLTNVLFTMSIDAEHMSVLHFIQLLDHLAENPDEYRKYVESFNSSV